MADWWFFPALGALGASIIEAYVLVTKGVQSPRHAAKSALGVVVGFVLPFVLEASTMANAFALGVGWEATLSALAKESQFKQVSDPRVMRQLATDDCPTPETTIGEALTMMRKAGTTDRIPVVDGAGRLMGIVTDGMIQRALKDKAKSELPVQDIMQGATEVIRAMKGQSVAKAIRTIEQRYVRKDGRAVAVQGLPVIDSSGKVLGLVVTDDLKDLDKPLLEIG